MFLGSIEFFVPSKVRSLGVRTLQLLSLPFGPYLLSAKRSSHYRYFVGRKSDLLVGVVTPKLDPYPAYPTAQHRVGLNRFCPRTLEIHHSGGFQGLPCG